ncbi:MAG: hypothetical protein SNJ85_12320 [Cyanobacteriota bacterium]
MPRCSLQVILGSQPPVPSVGSREAQNRFHFLFGQFLRAIAQPQRPLVVFLDDLQSNRGLKSFVTSSLCRRSSVIPTS